MVSEGVRTEQTLTLITKKYLRYYETINAVGCFAGTASGELQKKEPANSDAGSQLM